MSATSPASPRDELLEEALSQGWYHRIELAPGRWTNGSVHITDWAKRLLPKRLDGLRVLDVGTFDGGWAFELERRGAAEIYAVDLASIDDYEWPPRNARGLRERSAGWMPDVRFKMAVDLLGSRAVHCQSRIYDISPELVGGPVDYAVISDLLLHLRDPIKGLAAVRRTLKPNGRLLVSEQVNLWLTITNPRRPAASLQTSRTTYNWWEANVAGLREWLYQAGFDRPHRTRLYRMPAVKHLARPHLALEQRPDPMFSD